MKLVVISHKVCMRAESSEGYVTDGGFPLQMRTISELFSRTTVLVPCQSKGDPTGLSPLKGNNLEVVPLTLPRGDGIWRKLGFAIWLLKNVTRIISEVRRADAVHTPIPGDVGTIGMIVALVFRKPLFVRHCGNWTVQRTLAERIWKHLMERYAGGRNVMLATGGGEALPSEKNQNIKWIFSTSLDSKQIAASQPRQLEAGSLRLVIACRQEERKGTDIVIESLPLIAKSFPSVTLDVIGSGSMLPALRRQAQLLAVDDRVIFHGKVPQCEVPGLMQQADIFCYPTTASEGFPKVVLEALASGLPVITTGISVLPHLISSRVGDLLDQASPDALAEAVVRLASDSHRYHQLSGNAIMTASQYSLENWGHYIGEELRRSWGLPSLRLNKPAIDCI